MNYQKQIERFQQIFEQNKAKFNSKSWEEDPNFLYFIEIPLSEKLTNQTGEILKKIQKAGEFQNGFFVSPWNLHITLALPGRLGVHFQGNEESFMKSSLQKIAEQTPKFEIELANLNCFPDVIFREILDSSGKLYQLHEDINKKIPFSQHPDYQMENFIPHVSFFYGGENAENIFENNFDRKLSSDTMTVDKIVFGRARNEDGKFAKEILQEFKLA